MCYGSLMENTATAYAQLATFGEVRTFAYTDRFGQLVISVNVDRPHTFPARPATRRAPAQPECTVMANWRGRSSSIAHDATVEHVIATVADTAEALADNLTTGAAR